MSYLLIFLHTAHLRLTTPSADAQLHGLLFAKAHASETQLSIAQCASAPFNDLGCNRHRRSPTMAAPAHALPSAMARACARNTSTDTQHMQKLPIFVRKQHNKADKAVHTKQTGRGTHCIQHRHRSTSCTHNPPNQCRRKLRTLRCLLANPLAPAPLLTVSQTAVRLAEADIRAAVLTTTAFCVIGPSQQKRQTLH